MKKSIILTALALAATVTVGAKTADELRVYINPGHGGWTPNDRPCTLVGHGAYSRTNTDTLSFYESNTDLDKGFGLLERLITYGLKFDRTLNQTGAPGMVGAARDMSNNIVMSRVKNGPYYDDNGTENQLISDGKTVPSDMYIYNRNLTEICAEVDANNFDMFISIHSNAASDGTATNYPLFLYRGYDTPTDEAGVTLVHQQTSRNMADKCWGYAFENPHMVWSYYTMDNKNIRGDISFYHSSSTSSVTGAKGYLGVLKHHVPGFLIEGYFHTYQPARHRAMNKGVCHIEGIAYARGIADYFGLAKEKTGDIYGIVRDQYEKFLDAAYKPSMKSADAYKPLNGAVVTLKKGADVVATYTTDNYYNGAFVFNGVEPGDYTLEFACEGYIPCDPVAVTVKAATTSYPTASLVSETWTPPTVIYENYPDPAAANKGMFVPDEFNLVQTYVDEPVAQLEGKEVRRAIAHEGKLYILAFDNAEKPNPTIVVYDPAAKKVLAEVSTEGTDGTEKNISDIQVTADGVLVACAKELCQYSDNEVDDGFTRGEHNVYKWTNDENGVPTGAPVKWFSSKLSGNMYRAFVGETMAYSGTSEEGEIIVPARAKSGTKFHFNRYSIIDGQLGSSGFIRNNGNWAANENTMGKYSFITSPLDDMQMIAVFQNQKTITCEYDDVENYTEMNFSGMYGATAFRFLGHSYLVMPTNVASSGGETVENVGLCLQDITAGIDNAIYMTPVNSTIAGVAAVAATAGEVEVVKNDNEQITDAYVNLYLVRDGKISRFTTKGNGVTPTAAAYAYGLKSEDQAATALVTYHATGDAPKAELILHDGDNDIVIPMGEAVKGENTYSLDKKSAGLEETKEYAWEVRLTNNTIASSGLAKTMASAGVATRGSVLVITDPKQASFGYSVFAPGKAMGATLFDPEGNVVAKDLFKQHALWGGNTTNQSNPFRGDERDGKFVFASWGDAASGVTYFDPLDLDGGLKNMYAGTKQGSGAYIYNGVNVGGGHAGLCFLGEGDNQRMYAFSEDHDTSVAPSNALLYWELGSAWLIDMAPKATGEQGRWQNTNCDLVAYGDGLFISQCRTSGNNSAGVPIFGYVGTDNKLKYNSGNEVDKEWIDSGNSGIAISKDGKTFALATYAGTVIVMDVTWTDGAPSMTKRFEFATSKASAWSTMRFDYAGNLHMFSRDNNGSYEVYAIAQEHPAVSTPALASDLIKGKTSLIESITEDGDNVDAPVVYYNLQGIQMSADNLTPGVYVRVQGDKATKVIIK